MTTLQQLEQQVKEAQDNAYRLLPGFKLCGICLDMYRDIDTHLGLFSNQNHVLLAQAKLRLDRDHCPYCGGDIDHRANGEHYQVQCSRCEYLFDED